VAMGGSIEIFYVCHSVLCNSSKDRSNEESSYLTPQTEKIKVTFVPYFLEVKLWTKMSTSPLNMKR
jgi:hypothetical protein